MNDAVRIDPTSPTCPSCGYELKGREVLYNDLCWRCFKVEQSIEQTILLTEIATVLNIALQKEPSKR